MKKPIIISALCVALAFALFLWGFGQGESAAPVRAERYVLLIENDTGSFVMQLIKGMRQAARELGATVTVCASVGEAERLNGLSGMVIWLSDPAQALDGWDGPPAVVVGRSCAGAVCVLGDDRGAGARLMRRALDAYGAERVALVRDDVDEHARARGDAARAEADGAGIAEVWYEEGVALPEGCAAAVATSPRATRALADLKRDGLFSGMVLGVDTGDERVSDLENGLTEVMALDSPYAMGYLALGKARALSRGEQAENAVTGVLLATRENMYLAENVKQVFPLLQ